MKHLVLLLCLGLSFPVLNNCRQPDPRILKVEPVTPDGSEISVGRNQDFEIVLPSTGESDYNWYLEKNSATEHAEFVNQKPGINEFEGRPAPEGYAPHQIFVFKAKSGGQAQLVFQQKDSADNVLDGVQRVYTITVF